MDNNEEKQTFAKWFKETTTIELIEVADALILVITLIVFLTTVAIIIGLMR